MPAEAAAARWQSRLTRMADGNTRLLLALWDGLSGYSWADADSWHAEARPIVAGTAEAALAETEAYATATVGPTSTPSPLIVADATARLYDPFDLIGHMILQGASELAAINSGRTAARALARDTVWRTARQGIAEMVTGVTGWVRRLDGDACDWCVSLSGVEWPSASAATFGHDNCGCLPVPASAIGNHNATLAAARGITTPADYSRLKQVNSLRRQERTATRRSRLAAEELLTETDPARRERLSIREQEWETRAERAAERLRLLAA